MFDIFLNDKVWKNLKKIPKFLVSIILDEIDLKLSRNPFFSPERSIKKLKGKRNEHRLKVKEYRVLYAVEDENVFVHSVKHRKDAYKKKS